MKRLRALALLALIATAAWHLWPTSPKALDLDGRSVAPLQSDAPAVTLLFVRSDCPVSNRYAPEIRRLTDRFAQENIPIYLVYADPDETPQAIRAHLKEYGHSAPPLRDPDHVLVAHADVHITPEAAVFLPDGRQIYRGRIDDRYPALGQALPAPKTRDLEDLLTAIAAGHPPDTLRTTEAIGCFLSDLK